MKSNSILTTLCLLLFLSPFTTKSQTSCSNIFISEILIEKKPISSEIFNLNYSLEIYNPTENSINLSTYSIVLEGSNGSINIPLSGTLQNDDVYVMSNSNSELSLQQVSNFLSSNIEFETKHRVTLKENNTVIDVVGEAGIPTPDNFNIMDIINNPNQINTSHIDLNDFESVDFRRLYTVQAGEATFANTDLLNQWLVYPSDMKADIGEHNSICNPDNPLGDVELRFSEPDETIYQNSADGITEDPLGIYIIGGGSAATITFTMNAYGYPINGSTQQFIFGGTGAKDCYYSSNPSNTGYISCTTQYANCNSLKASQDLSRESKEVIVNLACSSGCFVGPGGNSHKTLIINDNPSSISNSFNGQEVTIHRGLDNIRINSPEKCNLQIINTLGQKIADKTLTTGHNTVDIKLPANHLFILRLSNENGIFTQKI